MDVVTYELKIHKIVPYLAGGFAVLFAALAAVVKYVPSKLFGIDGLAHTLVLSLQRPIWSNVALIISDFGGTGGIIVGLVIITIVFCHRPDIITRLWIALLGSTLSGAYVKDWVHRLRPDTLPWLQPINSYSFPSAHALSATVFYGFLALLLYVHAPTRFWKTLALVVPGIAIFLIGLSRIALNYHYVSDVLGGFLLGGFWLSFSLSFPLYRELYHEAPEENRMHREPIIRAVL